MSKRAGAKAPEFSTHGTQPSGRALNGGLLGDPAVMQSVERFTAAQDVEPVVHAAEPAKAMQTTQEPGEPKVQAVRLQGNSTWDGRLVSIPVNIATQVLSRDPGRVTVDITNQSTLIVGTAATCYLFGSERDANNFAAGTAAARTRALSGGIHCTVLPDGAGRTFTHTASVWAVLVGSGDHGVLDISHEAKDRA